MFIGHFALAFATKRVEPSVSLGTYFAAAQLPDVLWPCFLLAGVEHVTIAPGSTAFTPLRFDSYPVSHSLLTVIGWGALMGGLHWWRKRRLRAAVTIALLVVSHWVLDWVTHRPDMPLTPWSPLKLGLGLWNSVVGTLVVESTLFVGGVCLYLSANAALPEISACRAGLNPAFHLHRRDEGQLQSLEYRIILGERPAGGHWPVFQIPEIDPKHSPGS